MLSRLGTFLLALFSHDCQKKGNDIPVNCCPGRWHAHLCAATHIVRYFVHHVPLRLTPAHSGSLRNFCLSTFLSFFSFREQEDLKLRCRRQQYVANSYPGAAGRSTYQNGIRCVSNYCDALLAEQPTGSLKLRRLLRALRSKCGCSFAPE